MKHVQFPSIVNFIGAYATPDRQFLWVVMELMDGPSLAQILEISTLVLSEFQIAKIAHDV